MLGGLVMRGSIRLRHLALGLLGSTMLAGAGSVQAQPASSGSDTGQVETVIVSAQKRDENIQNIPFSIQALSTQTLEDHQVQSFDDYTKLLPSVSFQSLGPGSSQLFFRGVVSVKDGNPFGALPTAG